MGIKDLNKVITEHAEKSFQDAEMKAFLGRKVAVDASMSLYQFLIAVRQDGSQLTNEAGETTSHLNGMFYRTIRMMENGLKPVYVFDGKPPEMKSGELEKRTERRDEAQKQLDEAMEKGDQVAIEKFERRLVKVTKEQNEQVKRLLRAMGVPVVEAPCEAEAQCAELVRAGQVYATATEDMDALTFGSNVLLRHLTFSEAKKIPIKKYQPPENWKYKEARELFLKPDVQPGAEVELLWKDPDDAEVLKIMCEENQFTEERIRTALARLKKTKQTSQQVRIDQFFVSTGLKTTEPSAKKRKVEEEKNNKIKKGKGVPFKKRK